MDGMHRQPGVATRPPSSGLPPGRVATPTPEYRPAVKHGLMTAADADRLKTLTDQARMAQEMGNKQYIDRFLDELAEVSKALCQKNVPLFGHLFMGYDVVPFTVDVWRDVERSKNSITLLPRDHSKSWTLTRVPVVHHVCYSTVEGSGYEDPRIMVLRESDDAAKTDMGRVQAVLETGGPTGLIKRAFGDLKSKARKWNEHQIQLSSRFASDYTVVFGGFGGSITGSHPYRLIVDDMATRKNSKTETQKRDVWGFWTQTVRGLIGPLTRTTILGTRYGVNDLYDMLMRDAKYKVIKKPALTRMPSQDDFEPILAPGGQRLGVKLTEKGLKELNALWPCPAGEGDCQLAHPDPHVAQQHEEEYGVHRSVQYLIHEKWLEDPIDFVTQFMLEVAPPTAARITSDILYFWSDDANNIGRIPMEYEGNDHKVVAFPKKEEIAQVIHAWDHAIGKRREHDFTALARLFRTRDNKVFVKIHVGKYSVPEALSEMESWFESEIRLTGREPSHIVTEAIGFQEAYAQMLQATSRRILADKIEPVKKGGKDKDEFLNESGVVRAMMAGQLFIEYEDTDTINELLLFTPEKSAGHDDRVDALAMGFGVIKAMAKRPAKFVSLSSASEREDLMEHLQRL